MPPFALLSAALALLIAVSTSTAQFAISQVEFGSKGDDVNARVREVLARDGLLAVTDVPGLAQARYEALVTMAQCTLTYGEHVAPLVVELKDLSKRASWAAVASSRKYPRDPVDDTVECPNLQVKMERLRDLVDLASIYFVSLLDSALRLREFDGGMMSKRGSMENYDSFSDLVNNADHLDHFHVYEKQSNTKLTLELHLDQGLFIAIVPAIRVSEAGDISKQEDSFYIDVVGFGESLVKVPASGNAIVFMVGDGINHLRRASHFYMRAVPHSLNLVAQTPVRSVRAWFGRMFFAPKDALLNGDSDTTFQSLIDKVIDARKSNKDFPSLSCAKTDDFEYRMLADSTGGCNSDFQIYCWMSCKNVTNLSCPVSEAICLNGTGNGIWVDCPTCHDGKAKPACASVLNTYAPTTLPTSSPFSPTSSPIISPTSSPIISPTSSPIITPTSSPNVPSTTASAGMNGIDAGLGTLLLTFVLLLGF